MEKTDPAIAALMPLVDVISNLEMASKALRQIGAGFSLAKTARNEELKIERSKATRFIQSLEEAYGIPLTNNSGPHGAKQLEETEEVSEWLDVFHLHVSNLVATKDQLLLLKSKRTVPSVSIGTWTGVGLYLVPALTKELVTRFESAFDLSIGVGRVSEVFSDLVKHRYDFAILPSNDSRAKLMGLVETKLFYRMPTQGVNFLYKDSAGRVPFPDLNAVVDSPNEFSSKEFIRILRSSTLAVLPPEGTSVDSDFNYAIADLLIRDKSDLGKGQRIKVPNFMTELLMVRMGLAVGFGNPPRKKLKKQEARRFPGFTVEVFEEPGRPGNVIAYFPPESLYPYIPERNWSEPQTFSVYRRDTYVKKPASGGQTAWATTVLDVVDDFCGKAINGMEPTHKQLQRKYPWLQYNQNETGETFLVHDMSRVTA